MLGHLSVTSWKVMNVTVDSGLQAKFNPHFIKEQDTYHSSLVAMVHMKDALT